MPRRPGAIFANVCYLSEQHRQSDKPFLEVLAAIRANACIGLHRERLAARQIEQGPAARGCTRLFTHNAAVDEINQRDSTKLGGEMHPFTMARHGPCVPFVEALKRGLPVAGNRSPQERRRGDVHQERSGRPLRQRHARLGGSFDPDDSFPLVRTRGGKRILAEPSRGRSTRPARSGPVSRKYRSGSPGRSPYIRARACRSMKRSSISPALSNMAKAMSRCRDCGACRGLSAGPERAGSARASQSGGKGRRIPCGLGGRACGHVRLNARACQEAAFLAACRARSQAAPAGEPANRERPAYPKSYQVAA